MKAETEINDLAEAMREIWSFDDVVTMGLEGGIFIWRYKVPGCDDYE